MKILLDKYPKGTYKGQKSDGRYIDGYVYNNLSEMADKIVEDMTFMGVVFSSTLEVGTGKSVLSTQIGEAWTDMVNKKHNLNLTFDMKNIIFNPKKFMEVAYSLPKYSFILLDEWEGTHYWSELAMTLRTFFQKCRQLNLFMIVVIPNFFQLPLQFAISRSAFAIDVRFEEGFERGYFSFYGFEAKKKLRILGSRNYNYKVVQPSFVGRFLDGYGVPDKEYRTSKLKDMLESEVKQKNKRKTDVQTKAQIAQTLYSSGKLTHKQIAGLFKVTRETITKWINNDLTALERGVAGEELMENYYNLNLNNKEIVWDEGRVEEEENK